MNQITFQGFEDCKREIRHPAKYSDQVIPVLVEILNFDGIALDLFGGSGKIKKFAPVIKTKMVISELEFEWARLCDLCADALRLPFPNNCFDAVFTSPTYGNRMADDFECKDGGQGRNTYRHALSQPLSKNNSGRLQWGEEYQAFHKKAWTEVWRVLRPGGFFILNISDHIRGGEVMPVTEWHGLEIIGLGFTPLQWVPVFTPRNKHGANRNLRVEYESIWIYHKPWSFI